MTQALVRGPRLPRFFVPPAAIDGRRVSLRGPAAHQLRHVLRVRPGDEIMLLDNTGWEFETVVETVGAESCAGRIVGQHPSSNEPRVRLTLYAALLKHDKFEWVLQKGVELGVAAFQPVSSARCVGVEASSQKLERWRRIVREAAEQSERGVIPLLAAPLPLAEAVAQAAHRGLSLIPFEEERILSLRAALRAQPLAEAVSLFIGPEGGFSPAEIELARAHQVVPVALGLRILRAETASLAAVAAVMYEYGEMG
jgi:16S rRNA (uracil1498-N3)-methyltransferase